MVVEHLVSIRGPSMSLIRLDTVLAILIILTRISDILDIVKEFMMEQSKEVRLISMN